MLISEILSWCLPVEREARATYCAALECFAANAALVAFLQSLAEDETVHEDLLIHAQDLLARNGLDRPASILADDQSRQRILQPLRRLQAQAQAHALTERNALQGIVEAEFCEFNHVFLYVLTQFRQQAPVFQHVAAVIQQHQQRITEFIANLPEDQRPPGAFPALPRVWDRRLLVVDDEEGLRMALAMFLGLFGQVTIASNGKEALAHTRQQFFDVIISDVNMPQLNGLEFYQALVSAHSPDRSRFIFCTGEPPAAVQELCTQGQAQLILKPFAFDAVRQAVRRALDQKT